MGLSAPRCEDAKTYLYLQETAPESIASSSLPLSGEDIVGGFNFHVGG
ncbi:hypothetical protein [Streptomyces phage phiScoe56]|nr:hypothetical protein [Streptomyces phage phiScoe56]